MDKVIIMTLLMLLPLGLFCQEGVTIQWSEVEGAKEYIVELFLNDLQINTIETQDTQITLTLAPGLYEYQIVVLNKFGQEASKSQLKTLRVERIMTPLLRNTNDYSIYQNQNFSAEVEILYLQKDSQIWLQQGDFIHPVEIIDLGDNHFQLNATDWPEEDHVFTLFISNHDNKTSEYPNFLNVIMPLEPDISNLNPDNLEAGYLYQDIELSGSNLSEELQFELKNAEGIIPIIDIQWVSENSILFSLNVKESTPGNYDLYITAPWDETYKKNRILSLSENESKQKYYHRRNWSNDILIGFRGLNIPEPNGDIIIDNAFDLQWRMDYATDIALFRNMGFLIQNEYDFQDPQVITLSFGSYFRTRRSGNLNFYGSVQLGLKIAGDRNGPLFLVEGGLDLQFRRILIDLVINAGQWYPPENISENFIKPVIRLGYRL
ncbi:MAG: hypothetical protein PF447_09685 [Spirochaetaceae bacterium]|jgi:hypothetical protein|nr:hypothetical protein [Spirochaetaceae bacterium]